MSPMIITGLFAVLGCFIYVCYFSYLISKYGIPNGGLCLLYYITNKGGESIIYCCIMSIIPFFVMPSYLYISSVLYHSTLLFVLAIIALFCASLMFVFPKYRESKIHNILAFFSRVLFLVWAIKTGDYVILAIPLTAISLVVSSKLLRKRQNIDRRFVFLTDFICYFSFIIAPLIIYTRF